MRYLGIDLGTKTTGVSISDRTGLIASAYKNLPFSTNNQLVSDIKEIITKETIDHVVIGFPKNMNNTIGPRAESVLVLKELLEKSIDIKVSLQDERLSSKEGNNLLIQNNTRRDKRKQVIDRMAASIFLQTFLDKERNTNNG